MCVLLAVSWVIRLMASAAGPCQRNVCLQRHEVHYHRIILSSRLKSGLLIEPALRRGVRLRGLKAPNLEKHQKLRRLDWICWRVYPYREGACLGGMPTLLSQNSPCHNQWPAQWSVWRKHCDWFGRRDTTKAQH